MHNSLIILLLLGLAAFLIEARYLPENPLPIPQSIQNRLRAKDSKSIFSKRSKSPGTLQLDFNVKRSYEALRPRDLDLLSRDTSDTLEVPLTNRFTYYNVEIELGTPAQKFNVLIDTGSSDLWVIDSSNEYCASNKEQLSSGNYIDCSRSGTFDSSASSTWNKNNSLFYIKYGDGTVAEGDWGTDTLTIEGTTITNMSFGLGSVTNSSLGILGVGYATNEATVGIDNDPYTYRNLPLRLVDEGLINIPAFSLWLNDLNADTGSILFGGVDHAKYDGNLIKVPVLVGSRSKVPTAFLVALDSLTFESDNVNVDVLGGNPMAALLDSGTSLSYFPESVAKQIIEEQFDGLYYSRLGYYIQACDFPGNLVYNFSGATITVPFSSFLFPIVSSSGKAATSKDGQPVCAIGILPFSSSFALLGDTFLRNAYVVYDLKNNEIALAQAKLNQTDSNIEAIVSNIPSATPAALYSSTSLIAGVSGTYTARPRTSIVETETGTAAITLGSSTDTGSSSSSSTSSGRSQKSSASAMSTPSIFSLFSLMTFSLIFSAGFFLVFL